MVFRMELTYNEIEIILDMKYRDTSTTAFTFPQSIFAISDVELVVKSILPEEVKVVIRNDDIKLKPNLTTNKTFRFTEKSF